MKPSLKYFAIFLLILGSRIAIGQSNFKETVTRGTVDPAPPTSNYWFAPILNASDPSGKSITLYLTSENNTTAHVISEGVDKAIPIKSFGVATFTVPLKWEMTSSGVVENKGIHVYDKTDNITVCLKSSSNNASGGMHCIPVSGLGTDYVVAGFGSNFGGTTTFDLPSEFTITAASDSTVIEITPSCDLRQSDSFPALNNIVAFHSGEAFTVTLNSGECVQYQAALAQNSDTYDVTGTIIHSNNPVGVVGGSMAPNVPLDFPYANYICDMIPPVNAWGKTYFTVNNIQPQGAPENHNNNLYSLISSVPEQTIARYDCATGNHVEAVLGPAFDHYYTEETGANKWYSDQPFMLVQYFNSSTYPDGNAGDGSPCEIVINPKESFTNSIIQFLTPNTVGNQQPYNSSYANITVNIKDTANVWLDKTKIHNYSSTCLNDTFAMFFIPHLTDGAHFVTSDSGCGVYVYGYDGSNRTAYSWSAASYPAHDPYDSIPPNISFVNGSDCVHGTITDVGLGLNSIEADSINNFTFQVDTGFVPGSGDTITFVDFCVLDSTQSGILFFTALDLGGSYCSTEATYTPSQALADVSQELQTKVSVTLTPNPAAKSVSLDFSLSQTENVSFELSSMDGNALLNWNSNAESVGDHQRALDISSLASGSYIYRFEANGEAQSGKLIINR